MTLKSHFAGCIALFLVLAGQLAGAATYETWCKSRNGLLNDKSVFRYYDFEMPVNGRIFNRIDPEAGFLIIAGTQEQAIGRWPGKQALSVPSEADTIHGMRFYGTESGSFTAEMWVCIKDAAKPHFGSILYMSPGFDSWRIMGRSVGGVDLYVGSTVKIVKMFGRDDKYAPDRITSKNQHTWHQVAVSWNNETKKISLYVDGELTGDSLIPKGLPLPKSRNDHEPENDVYGLGIGGKPSPKHQGLDFKIDELVIYGRALSADEIRRRYVEGCPEGNVDEQLKAVAKDSEEEAAITAIRMDVRGGNCGYFPKGEKFAVDIKGLSSKYNWRNPPAEIRIETVDSEGCAVPENSVKLSLAGQREQLSNVQMRFGKCGLYWINLTVNDASGHVIRRQAVPVGIVRQLPGMPGKIAGKTPLGAVDVMTTQPECLALDIGISRIICYWSQIEPKKDELEWGELDERVESNVRNGLETVICFTGNPGWTDKPSPSSAFPSDIQKYCHVLQLMVNRYSGQVKYWEIWNAPNREAGDLNRNSEDYVRLLRNAYEIVHQADKSAKVIGICSYNASSAWLKSVLAWGGLDSLDIVSFQYQGPATALYQESTSPVGVFEKILKGHSGKGYPLWNTATGQLQPARISQKPVDEMTLSKIYGNRMEKGIEPFVKLGDRGVMPSENRGAAWLVKDILLQMSDGVGKYFFNQGLSHYYPALNSSDGEPSLKGIACANLATQLIPAKSVERMKELPPEAIGVFIKNDLGKTAVIFTTRNEPVGIQLIIKGANKTVKGMDMLGNPMVFQCDGDGRLKLSLTQEPVYVFDIGEVIVK